MLTVIIFILVLAILIFVHELGHFLVAKWNGVKVEEFGFGFPPRIWGIKKGETVYSINWIPLGGFVKIFGEEGEEKENRRSFAHKKIWQRTAILLAGVAMNVFLAIAVLAVGYSIGLPSAIDDNSDAPGAVVQIAEVVKGSPAEAAGLKTGDVLLSLSYQTSLQESSRVQDVQEFINQNKGKEIVLEFQRGSKIMQGTLIPRANPPAGEGPAGVALARVIKVSYPWYRAIYQAAISVFNLIWLVIYSLGYLIWQVLNQGRAAGEVIGPVGIFSLTGQAAQMGLAYVLQLTALLSVNLAIVNALPFPALDGGRVIFLIIEKIKGSPVSQAVERAIHSAGFIFLIALMLLITLRDVMKLF